MFNFDVTVHVQWPKLKLIINSPRGVKVVESMYDTALTNFEVHVRNELQSTINQILKRRSDDQRAP
jgi:hypothetical protein